jgi:dienelactone hydrolase
MGYCVIIPNIIAFGDETPLSKPGVGTGRTSKSRIRESIEDLRRVILWAANNGGRVAGLPD